MKYLFIWNKIHMKVYIWPNMNVRHNKTFIAGENLCTHVECWVCEISMLNPIEKNSKY